RLRRVDVDTLDHRHLLVVRPGVERGATSEGPHLLGQVLVIVTRRRPERDTTSPPVRGADRTLPGPTGSLLPPDLLRAARHLAAGLRRSRSLPLVREIRLHRLVEDRLVDDPVEGVARKLQGVSGLASGL